MMLPSKWIWPISATTGGSRATCSLGKVAGFMMTLPESWSRHWLALWQTRTHLGKIGSD